MAAESLFDKPGTALADTITADAFITAERRRAVTALIARFYPMLFLASVEECAGNPNQGTDDTLVYLSLPKPVRSHRGPGAFVMRGLVVRVDVDGFWEGE